MMQVNLMCALTHVLEEMRTMPEKFPAAVMAEVEQKVLEGNLACKLFVRQTRSFHVLYASCQGITTKICSVTWMALTRVSPHRLRHCGKIMRVWRKLLRKPKCTEQKQKG